MASRGSPEDAGDGRDGGGGALREAGGGSLGDGGGGGGAAGALDRHLSSEALPASARCPFCGERDSEQFSSFGSQLSTSQYYCRRCRTVFEFMKWRR